MNADQYPYTRFFQNDICSLEDRGALGPRVILSTRPVPELEELLALRIKVLYCFFSQNRSRMFHMTMR